MFNMIAGVTGMVLGIAGVAYGIWARNNPETDADVKYGVRCRRVAPTGIWSRRSGWVGFTFQGQAIDFVDEVQIAFRNFGPSRLNADDQETPVIVHLDGDEGQVLIVESECAHKVGEREVEFALLPSR